MLINDLDIEGTIKLLHHDNLILVGSKIIPDYRIIITGYGKVIIRVQSFVILSIFQYKLFHSFFGS